MSDPTEIFKNLRYQRGDEWVQSGYGFVHGVFKADSCIAIPLPTSRAKSLQGYGYPFDSVKSRYAVSSQRVHCASHDRHVQRTEVSIKRVAVPIILIGRPMIVDLMIEKGFGVNRRPLELYDDRMDEIIAEPKEG